MLSAGDALGDETRSNTKFYGAYSLVDETVRSYSSEKVIIELQTEGLS